MNTEDKEEFLNQVAGKEYIYNIRIWGYGGELVYGKLTKAQHDFWQAECDKEDAQGYDLDDQFGNYLFDQEDFEETHGITVPDEAKIDAEWHDCDDLAHSNGANLGSANITIEQVDSDEYNAKILKDVIDSQDLEEFIKDNNTVVNESEFDLDEDGNRQEDGHNYCMYAMSVEKGTFFDGILKLHKPIDIRKISISTTEYPNGDNIVDELHYEGADDIDNSGGDTNGKSMNAYVMDY